jgi:DNA end-binding protein Ku
LRSLWKGVLSFGLVTIPVRLYTATESKDVRLRYLHAPCAAPVQYRKVCTLCGEEVTPDAIALGYEAGPDTFVVLKEEELNALPTGPDHTVEIERFVPLHSVDPLFLAKAYYLEPAPGGHKAYQLLRRAMDEEGRAAVVRIALRQRERWALVRAGETGVLHLETLLDADEVRAASQVQVGEEAALRPGELELARDLVRALASEFHPEDSPDRYREALTALIERKVAGGEARTTPREENRKVIDLMEALRQSLSTASGDDRAQAAAEGPSPTKGRVRRGRSEPAPPPPPRTHAGPRGGAGLR